MTDGAENMIARNKRSTPIEQGSVGAAFAGVLLDFAVRKGAPRAILLQRSGIDPAALADPDNRVPLLQYIRLLRTGKELCRDPALALHFGESFALAEMSPIGSIGHETVTLAGAISLLNRYSALAFDSGNAATDRFQLERRDGDLWLVDHRTDPNEFPELTESSFARMVCALRRRLGKQKFLRTVRLTYPEPLYGREYRRLFRSPIVFEADRNALVLTGSWLNVPLPVATNSTNHYVTRVLTRHANSLVEALEADQTITGRVEGIVSSMLQTGRVRIDQVARKLGLSRQTLFRRLKAEGATFESVRDGVRRKLALHYLDASKFSLSETSYLLGFSEPAAFSRAFKRWTGKSPRAFLRARHRSAQHSKG